MPSLPMKMTSIWANSSFLLSSTKFYNPLKHRLKPTKEQTLKANTKIFREHFDSLNLRAQVSGVYLDKIAQSVYFHHARVPNYFPKNLGKTLSFDALKKLALERGISNGG